MLERRIHVAMKWIVPMLVVAACGGTPSTPPTPRRAEPPVAPSPAESDPYDYRTWTAKLGDPREVDRAVTELEQLGHPEAIPALGAAWRAQGRPVRMLQVMVSLSRPLTPEQARTSFVTDYEETGRPASWKLSLPFLVEAVTTMNIADPRSVDSAVRAADAIGESMDPAGLDALIGVTSMPPQREATAVQLAAIRALGKFRDEKRAGDALVKIIESEPPPAPRAAALDERFVLFLTITGASINAIGELRFAPAQKALVTAMSRTPELFMQIRRALVAIGTTVKDELRAIVRDESDPAKVYYAAIVLGDFHDPAATPDLLAALKRPTATVELDDHSSPTQHDAVFDALRKTGAPEAAAPLRSLWKSAKTDLLTRLAAIAAYPFVARDDAAVGELGRIASGKNVDGNLQQEAASALALLGTNRKAIAILDKLAARELAEAAAIEKRAGPQKLAADNARLARENHKRILETAKASVVAIKNDRSKSPDEIAKATADVRRLEDDFRMFENATSEVIAPYLVLESRTKVHRARARMFHTRIGSIEIAMRCQKDLACYANALTLTPAESAQNASLYIPGVGGWTDIEKRHLLRANVERAMLEIGKRGAQAAAHMDALLAAAKSDDRLVRQAVLLALPKIAKIPCAPCATGLDAAIKAGEGKDSLGDLNEETALLRNYFASAGRAP